MEEKPIKRLQSGDVPEMVGWYEPRLLARIALRTVISSLFGQYADQRLIQAATDVASVDSIIQRYDFRDQHAQDAAQRIRMDENGAFWIDYIADIGDGFEPTYTTAYLLSCMSLSVPGAGNLKAGDILIMGGDQCYPQATREDYKRRLQLPYDWAFNVPFAQRKLFAIPGNHDWYDGLSAFDSLFCAARDRLSSGKGNKIGGWQCMQHRSYWALRLPHNWWIWGADIQFSRYLDVAQVNYFEKMAEEMEEGDRLILCLAEPTWMLAEFHGLEEDTNFFKITSIARERGVQICAVIAGDWHHYNRYYTPEIDVHFFTAGGGGSFLHPTHVLKNELTVSWPKATGTAHPDPGALSAESRTTWSSERVGMRLKKKRGTLDSTREVMEDVVEPLQGSNGSKRPVRQRDAKCYPSKTVSAALSLRNLAFPFHNFFFGMGIGFLYWLITWQFYSIVTQHKISAGRIDAVGLSIGNEYISYWSLLARLPLYLINALLVSISLFVLLAAVWVLMCWYVQGVEKPRWRHYLVKGAVGTLHWTAHVVAMFSLGLALVMFHNLITPTVQSYADQIWRARDAQPEIVRQVIKETLEPLAQQSAEQRRIIAREIEKSQSGPMPVPSDEPLPPLRPIIESTTEASDRVDYSELRKLVGLVLYPIEMIFIGGFIGAFIWGLYWVLAGLLLRMHAEDAFAALRIKDYRNFLRMKFEPDKVTIYPLGLDKTPTAAHWMAPPRDKVPPLHNPQLVPTRPIDLRLIEEPIVIRAWPSAEAGVAADLAPADEPWQGSSAPPPPPLPADPDRMT